MEEHAHSFLGRPVLHELPLAPLGHRHAEADLIGLGQGVVYEVHPLGRVRAVLAHGRGDHIPEDLLPLLHRRGGIAADIHRLGRDLHHLNGVLPALADTQPQLLDAQVQLIAHFLQPCDDVPQVCLVVKIELDLVQRDAQSLQPPDGPDAGKSLGSIVAVAAAALLHVRLQQALVLIVEQDAAGDVQGPGHLSY